MKVKTLSPGEERQTRWVPPWKRREDPHALTEHLRVIYQDYVFNSPIGAAMSIYCFFAWPDRQRWLFAEVWMVLWILYLLSRFTAGLVHIRRGVTGKASLKRWAAGAVWSQAIDGLFVSSLALFIYPYVDTVAQLIILSGSLVLVGATVFSLSARWISMAVYAPPVYLSFAWSTWHVEHPYARGFSMFTLAMFGLYVLYASNQRRSVLKGFELAKLNGELAAQLQAKNAELQEVALARSRLLATVSHDLRQPAHAIGLLAERALADTSAQSLRQSLHSLDELSQSLSASLTTLMDLTRLDAGLVHAKLAPVSLSQVLLRLEAEFAATAKSRGLQLNVPRSDLWVQSDPVLLHGVLANLVSNAIKYTRVGRVDVLVVRDGSTVTVSVRDTGVGIPPEKYELIFKEFVRLDSSESGTEGLGLGLSIVRRYAALMNHALGVQSEPGRGSCFAIEIPVLADDSVLPQAAARLGASDARLAGLRVLVVDNVDLVLSSMVRTLQAWQCEVHAARSLDEAREVVKHHELDLLISDFHLGDNEPDGLMLISTIRALGGTVTAELPALLMTGDVSGQLEADAQRFGVDILHKPVRPSLLQHRLLTLLQHLPVRSE